MFFSAWIMRYFAQIPDVDTRLGAVLEIFYKRGLLSVDLTRKELEDEQKNLDTFHLDRHTKKAKDSWLSKFFP